MHLPMREQCFAAFEIGNDHVWQFDSNSFIVSYCVAYQLVTLLGNYIHWSCEMSNLHIPNSDTPHCHEHVLKLLSDPADNQAPRRAKV